MKPALRGLYAVTPDGTDADKLLRLVGKALAGGATLFQFRSKSDDIDAKRKAARLLTVACRYRGAALIVNDDVELAYAVGASGVHLGRDDGDIFHARRRLGRDAIVGASCYADLDRARRMLRDGADYVAFGAVYPSRTKPDATQAPLALIERAHRELPGPICAIGGITLARAPLVMAAGADMLAVASDLFDAPDVERRTRDYLSLLNAPAQGGAPSPVV